MQAHLMIGGAFGLLLYGHLCLRRAVVEVAASSENLARLALSRRGQPPAADREFLPLDSSAPTEPLPPVERDANARTSAPHAVAQVNQESLSYVDARNAADLLEEDLLACFPFTGTHAFTTDWELSDGERTLLNQWREWRSKSIADLPEDLRFDSCHRSAIHNYFDQAIHGFLNEKAADSISRAEEPVPSLGGPARPASPTGSISLTAVTLVGTSEQTASIYYVAR